MTTIHWDMHRWETEFALDNLGDYWKLLEDQFEILREKERKRIPKYPPAVLSEEDEGESYAEWEADTFAFEQRYERNFPLTIRYSFVVLLYILFETRLKAACDEISRRSDLELKEGDFKGTPIERASTFLRKVAHVSVKENASWQWIADFQKVRHCIVHTNGQIGISRDNGAHLKKLCKKNIGLSVEGGDLMIEQRYLLTSLEKIKSFFQVIFDSTGFGPSMPVIENSKN